MYMSSPSTLTKFTILSSFRDLMADMVGTLFTAAKELPEPPKPTFLKSLFGGGTSSLDREELFGESNAGKPSKTTARHIPGTSAGMEQMKAQTGTMAAEMARLREVCLTDTPIIFLCVE
jgi:syntaxin-binding protein 5